MRDAAAALVLGALPEGVAGAAALLLAVTLGLLALVAASSAGRRDDLRAAARKGLERWRDDPALFAKEVLGVVRLWDGQLEILRRVAAVVAAGEGRALAGFDLGNRRKVAVRSGQKCGKSRTIAILALWYAVTRTGARVVLTAPSGRQVKAITWREVRDLYRRAKWPLGGDIAHAPETGLRFADGSSIEGFSTDEPEKAAGISGARLLLLVDEASGVADAIFEALEGNSAGGAVLVLFSNPTKTSGTFFDAFHGKAAFWERVHLSSEDAAAVDPPIPGLATRAYILEKQRDWGADSPIYAVRILGNFPSQASNAVIPLALVEAAVARGRAFAESGRIPKAPLALGVDVARYGGDDTAIVWRRGLYAARPIVFAGADEKVVAARVRGVAHEKRLAGETPTVNVDVVGVGAAVVALLEMGDELEVNAVHAQDRATAEGFAGLRSQLWWGLREWLKEGGAIADDPKLVAELVAPTYSFDAQGRIVVESKDSFRKRLGGRSPDRADALALAVFDAGSLSAEMVVNDSTRFAHARFGDARNDARLAATLDEALWDEAEARSGRRGNTTSFHDEDD